VSAYVVDAAAIDGIVAGAIQYGRSPEPSFSFVRFFRESDQNTGGYSAHRFSPYAGPDEAPETFNPETIGRELWTENLRSIHARYPDTSGGGLVPGPGDFSELEAVAYEYGPGARVVDVDPLGLLGLIRGFEYQACEHRDWRWSIAYAFCEALKALVAGRLIDLTGACAWTISDLSEIEGTLEVVKAEDPGGAWSMRFVPGRGEAVSLMSMIGRRRS
jgi:hypothetical protein